MSNSRGVMRLNVLTRALECASGPDRALDFQIAYHGELTLDIKAASRDAKSFRALVARVGLERAGEIGEKNVPRYTELEQDCLQAAAAGVWEFRTAKDRTIATIRIGRHTAHGNAATKAIAMRIAELRRCVGGHV